MLTIGVAVALGGCGYSERQPAASPSSSPTEPPSASGFDGAQLPPNVHARNFTLVDQHGQSVSLGRYRGHVVILAFLSSTATTSALIAQQIRGALDDLGRPVPALAVSVGPAADTPARVAGFLREASLAGRLEYLTGSPAQLRPIWRAYGVVPASAASNAYARSAFVLLIDRHGLERVTFPVEELTPEGLAHDIRRLESEGS